MIDPAIELSLTSVLYPVMAGDGPWLPAPGVSHLIVSLDRRDDGKLTELATVNVTRSRVEAMEDGAQVYILRELGAEWLIEFDVVRVPRDQRGHRYGLRIVSEVLAELSTEVTCHAVILAEPSGWQSLKLRDRAPSLVALDRHWGRLGFEGDGVRADVPGRQMSMTVRGYQVPEVALGS